MRDLVRARLDAGHSLRRARQQLSGFLLLQISAFPTGDFGSNRQAVSLETDRPFRSKAAPHLGGASAPALANRCCRADPILPGADKASTLIVIVDFGCCCGRL
jgi:hypothetical protein